MGNSTSPAWAGSQSEQPSRKPAPLAHAFLRHLLTTSCLVMAYAAPLAAQQAGSVTGRVVQAGTLAPLPSVQVYISGTGLGTLTAGNGRFLILTVPPGTYQIRAERIGYQTATREITVRAGQSTEASFELQEAVLGLDEIVVTGTAGAARRREIGNTVSQINLLEVQEPVVNMDALLQGRAAGLIITETSGQVGAGARIRLRGNVSASLSNVPLIYVDGVRIRGEGYPKNVPPTGYQGRGSNVVGNPLNDLNPNDIERIEVIKGAAATTLYGTEAAAGVIQIFTKRGHTGRAQWTAQIDQAAMHVQKFAGKWGIRGEPLQVPPQDGDPSYFYMDPFFRTGHRQNYFLSVGGGREDVQYFLSGAYEDVTGVHELDWSEKATLRGNVTFTPFQGLQFNWNTAYTNTDMQQTPNGGNAQGIHLNAQRRNQNYFNNGDPELIKREIYQYEIINKIDHFVTGLTATYAPTARLTNRVTVGYDLAQQEARQVRPFGFFFEPKGFVSNQRWSNTTLTLDYVGSYNFTLAQDLRSTFSWGGQSVTTDESSVHGQAQDLPGPGEPTLSSGAKSLSFEDRIRVINAGFFLQNVFDLKNRYFLTAGVRMDGNSAFGEDLGLEAYPKASLSYVISDEGFWNRGWGTLKLRAAWGQAGRAPGAFDVVRTWRQVGWGGKAAFLPNNVGNPRLGPERTTEVEVGFDGAFLRDRLTVDFTYYHQTTTDALFNVRLTPSLGFLGSQLRNVGKIENEGVELSVNATVLQKDPWGVDLGASVYTNDSRAVDLGGAPAFSVGVRGWVDEGKPVPVVRGKCITNPDEKADPVIESDCDYGPNVPDLGVIATAEIRLPYGATLSARGEYQGGAWAYSNFEGEGYTRGIRLPTCFNVYPLLESGRLDEVTAAERARCIPKKADRDFAIMPTDFFKVREVSLAFPVTALVPGARSARLTLAGRNIYRWKRKELFNEDPEAAGGWLIGQTGNQGNIMILGGTPPPAVYSASIRVVF